MGIILIIVCILVAFIQIIIGLYQVWQERRSGPDHSRSRSILAAEQRKSMEEMKLDFELGKVAEDQLQEMSSRLPKTDGKS